MSLKIIVEYKLFRGKKLIDFDHKELIFPWEQDANNSKQK